MQVSKLSEWTPFPIQLHLFDKIKRVRDLERHFGMSFVKIAPLISDVGDDRKTFALDVGTRRRFVVRDATHGIRIPKIQMVGADPLIPRRLEIAERPDTGHFIVMLDLPATGDKEDVDRRARLELTDTARLLVKLKRWANRLS
jgi:hypothetical protein